MRASVSGDKQIVAIPEKTDAGPNFKDTCPKCGVSDTTNCKWQSRCRSMDAPALKRVKELEAGLAPVTARGGLIQTAGECEQEGSEHARSLISSRAIWQDRSSLLYDS